MDLLYLIFPGHPQTSGVSTSTYSLQFIMEWWITHFSWNCYNKNNLQKGHLQSQLIISRHQQIISYINKHSRIFYNKCICIKYHHMFYWPLVHRFCYTDFTVPMQTKILTNKEWTGRQWVNSKINIIITDSCNHTYRGFLYAHNGLFYRGVPWYNEHEQGGSCLYAASIPDICKGTEEHEQTTMPYE